MTTITENRTTTTNGMAALDTSSNKLTDLFFSIGASRGKDIIPAFEQAHAQDRELALRIALWARDVRGGTGERTLFRNILLWLEKNDLPAAKAILPKIPELGRWDDVLIFKTPEMKTLAFTMVKEALIAGDGLASKWMPRKATKEDTTAAELRTFFGWTPKYYRKKLVELSSTVETQMCANQWDDINFSQVPSLASSRYKKAFNRHTPKYAEYCEKLSKGDTSVKVNAAAVYPYDVLKGINRMNNSELQHVTAQWDALPNFVGDANILPMIDVSGSMGCPAGGNYTSNATTCMDVAISLGMYMADKNTGTFKDAYLTFSEKPKLCTLPQGTIVDKYKSLSRAEWGMNTNLELALIEVLNEAKKYDVPQAEMPEILLIMSDMQFDRCVRNGNNTAMEMIKREYTNAGYQVPNVVFWNLNASSNVPVAATETGTALVSGFSPAIVKSVLSANMNDFTPIGIMKATIMNPRYDI